MKIRALISLTAMIIFSACGQEIPAPEDIAVPEFIDVKYDFGTFLENKYAVLTATLNTDNGIRDAGFMIGYDEASLSYKQSEVKDLSISAVLNFLEYDSEYCFYARATNGVNEIRTRLIRFRTPKKGEEFVPIPDDPEDNGGDNSGGGNGNGNDNPTGGFDDNEGSNPGEGETPGDNDGGGDENNDTPSPILPPEGVGITISDNNFLQYLLSLCDADKDGVILAEEAATVQKIDVCTDNIRTLDGIQYFTSITDLVADGTVWNGKLTSVCLEYNSKLERFSCRYNHISSFLLPASLIELDMRFNNITNPDFRTVPHLKKLDCFGCSITRLDLKPLAELEELVCGMNSFETLDVSCNLNLKLLDLSDSPYLKTVYVARGQKIATIIAENSIDFKYKE
ncbi:MAG: hypothetical protein ACI3ZL_09140 [Candidatus Cryptobacteroides sp.]